MAGGNYGALLLAFGLLFAVGFIVNIVVVPFAPIGEYNPDCVLTPLLNFVDDGITAGGVTVVNPFNWLGDGVHDFIVSQFSAFTFIPNIVSIPLLIIIFILLVYGVIKIVAP
jgi:hypothetical protein